MNLNQLQHFLLVAEEGSITRGAERAVVSQPAVSRAVAELEASLGVRLLDRGPHGCTPTDAGQVLLHYARRIFALEREASEALLELQGLEAGSIAIGASTTIGDYVLPSAIVAFLTAHPKIQISMEVANTKSVHQGVLEGTYDIGFTEGDVDTSIFEVKLLAEDELVIFASPRHSLAKVGFASLDQLSECEFVMRERGSGSRHVIESRFLEVGFLPTVVCSLGSTTAIKLAVRGGLGLGVVSRTAIVNELARGELVTIDTSLKLVRQLHTVRLGWRRESSASKQFVQDLRDQISAFKKLSN